MKWTTYWHLQIASGLSMPRHACCGHWTHPRLKTFRMSTDWHVIRAHLQCDFQTCIHRGWPSANRCILCQYWYDAVDGYEVLQDPSVDIVWFLCKIALVPCLLHNCNVAFPLACVCGHLYAQMPGVALYVSIGMLLQLFQHANLWMMTVAT
jgi:hypothetical protein